MAKSGQRGSSSGSAEGIRSQTLAKCDFDARADEATCNVALDHLLVDGRQPVAHLALDLGFGLGRQQPLATRIKAAAPTVDRGGENLDHNLALIRRAPIAKGQSDSR
ncbi:MAG: hypothetical protein ACXWXJ_09835 [Aeromicrobium sp.]